MEREIEMLREQDMRARHELDRTLYHVNNAENALIRGVQHTHTRTHRHELDRTAGARGL